jgi:integrase/recombinase XerD
VRWAASTRAYLRIIEDFARYFHRSPDKLGPDHIREYIAHLFRDKKLSDNSVNQTSELCGSSLSSF